MARLPSGLGRGAVAGGVRVPRAGLVSPTIDWADCAGCESPTIDCGDCADCASPTIDWADSRPHDWRPGCESPTIDLGDWAAPSPTID